MYVTSVMAGEKSGSPGQAMAADEIASRRRRSFRWCRSCRRVHPPESFVGSERVCLDCEAAVEQFDA